MIPMVKSDYKLSIFECAELIDYHASLFPELNVKECECLYLFSLGLRQKNVSDLMNVSNNMVKQHITNIKYKFNAESSEELRVIYHTRIQHYQLKTTNALISLLSNITTHALIS